MILFFSNFLPLEVNDTMDAGIFVEGEPSEQLDVANPSREKHQENNEKEEKTSNQDEEQQEEQDNNDESDENENDPQTEDEVEKDPPHDEPTQGLFILLDIFERSFELKKNWF